jgi:hypothetical protein
LTRAHTEETRRQAGGHAQPGAERGAVKGGGPRGLSAASERVAPAGIADRASLRAGGRRRKGGVSRARWQPRRYALALARFARGGQRAR